jgi:hypothetical protein
MLTRFLSPVMSLALLRTGLFNCRQMLHPSGMLHVFAICLAGFDEILTLQWGASRTGRPFHLADLSTADEERSLIQFLVQIHTPIG